MSSPTGIKTVYVHWADRNAGMTTKLIQLASTTADEKKNALIITRHAELRKSLKVRLAEMGLETPRIQLATYSSKDTVLATLERRGHQIDVILVDDLNELKSILSFEYLIQKYPDTTFHFGISIDPLTFKVD